MNRKKKEKQTNFLRFVISSSVLFQSRKWLAALHGSGGGWNIKWAGSRRSSLQRLTVVCRSLRRLKVVCRSLRRLKSYAVLLSEGLKSYAVLLSEGLKSYAVLSKGLKSYAVLLFEGLKSYAVLSKGLKSCAAYVYA